LRRSCDAISWSGWLSALLQPVAAFARRGAAQDGNKW
jgi:hypothetical protein